MKLPGILGDFVDVDSIHQRPVPFWWSFTETVVRAQFMVSIHPVHHVEVTHLIILCGTGTNACSFLLLMSSFLINSCTTCAAVPVDHLQTRQTFKPIKILL